MSRRSGGPPTGCVFCLFSLSQSPGGPKCGADVGKCTSDKFHHWIARRHVTVELCSMATKLRISTEVRPKDRALPAPARPEPPTTRRAPGQLTRQLRLPDSPPTLAAWPAGGVRGRGRHWSHLERVDVDAGQRAKRGDIFGRRTPHPTVVHQLPLGRLAAAHQHTANGWGAAMACVAHPTIWRALEALPALQAPHRTAIMASPLRPHK